MRDAREGGRAVCDLSLTRCQAIERWHPAPGQSIDAVLRAEDVETCRSVAHQANKAFLSCNS
jgi:hypothetical protein